MRAMKIVWNALSRREWADLLPPDRASLQQSWAYGEAMRGLGLRVHRAVIFEGQDVIGQAQYVMRRCGIGVGLCSRGPVWRFEVSKGLRKRALMTLKSTVPESGPKVLLITPDYDEAGIWPLMSEFHVAEIPLARDDDAMRAAMYGKWRNRLRAAERSGLRITKEQGVQALAGDLSLELAQQRTRGYRNLPAAFYKAWGKVHPETVVTFRAYAGSELVAVMIFLDHAPTASYQIGWANNAGRAVSAHNLLMWHAMQEFSGRGRNRLELGMLNTRDAPGLARFKLGSGAVARRIGASGVVLPKLRLPRIGTVALGNRAWE